MLQMGKMSMLELEMEDLHKVQKCLEREKEMAKEENEHLQRQVGCQIGQRLIWKHHSRCFRENTIPCSKKIVC